MKEDYWPIFWRKQGVKSGSLDHQSQVLRTLAKQPIDEKRWNSTLDMVRKQMQVEGGHRFLDLCCGNGLFTRYFASDCEQLLAVDISPDLLQGIGELELSKVETLECDMRLLDFSENSFDRILLYAAVQYLDPAEVIQLFERMAVWLEPGGILYLGDVPDRKRLWNFFNNSERQSTYFQNIRNGEAIVGTWFEPEWLIKLGYYAGFSEVRIIEQPDYMIYHTYRYEVVLVR